MFSYPPFPVSSIVIQIGARNVERRNYTKYDPLFKAQCRSKIEPIENEEPRSVNRVVASLIKTIEDSRLTAPDRPTLLNIDQGGQDVGTQTSPFSISRSSSFDWINDPTERGLRELKTPISTPR
uniref:Uncharacterized protein n=1 Tax=Heterorhabditis bacteriophora TaxID=37862 RepID=A0A1I7XC69_HETBA